MPSRRGGPAPRAGPAPSATRPWKRSWRRTMSWRRRTTGKTRWRPSCCACCAGPGSRDWRPWPPSDPWARAATPGPCWIAPRGPCQPTPRPINWSGRRTPRTRSGASTAIFSGMRSCRFSADAGRDWPGRWPAAPACTPRPRICWTSWPGSTPRAAPRLKRGSCSWTACDSCPPRAGKTCCGANLRPWVCRSRGRSNWLASTTI